MRRGMRAPNGGGSQPALAAIALRAVTVTAHAIAARTPRSGPELVLRGELLAISAVYISQVR
jgi:hypothetical protein